MKRRRVIVGLAAVVVVAVAPHVVWARGPRPWCATFDQVREGMTREEVYATPGGPPGDYLGGRAIPSRILGGSRRTLLTGATDWCLAADAELQVTLDADGRVTGTVVLEVVDLPPASPWDDLQTRLGLGE